MGENECFFRPQHCYRKWGDDGINPTLHKKLSLGAGSYVAIARAWKGFSHSPKFFCPPCRLSLQKCKMIQNLTAQLLLLLLLLGQLLLLLFFFYLSVNVVAKAGLDK